MEALSPLSAEDWAACEKCPDHPYPLAIIPAALKPAIKTEGFSYQGTDFLCREESAGKVTIYVHSDEPAPAIALKKLLRVVGLQESELLWRQERLEPPRFRIEMEVSGTMATFEPRGTFHTYEAAQSLAERINGPLEGHHIFAMVKEMPLKAGRER